MSFRLFFSAIVKFLFGVLIIGCLLFIPAGSFSYFNAWLFMGLLFIPMFIFGIFLMFLNPSLLRMRLNAREESREQRCVIALSGIMFFLGFVVAGLNYRFGWFFLPDFVVIISSILFVFFYLLYAEVLRENIFLSRTIEVNEGQMVIDTGLYGIVRHPMYSITILLFLSMPFVLNSIFSFFIFLFYLFIIVKRLKNEEIFLRKNLKGYSDYMIKVKYRLIPFVW